MSTSVQTRERIIKAALAAFSERGFEGASTRDIAARADANQAMIRHYFESKEGLWKAVVTQMVEEQQQDLARVFEAIQPLDKKTRAKLIIRQFVLFSGRNPELYRLILFESAFDNPRLQWLVEDCLGPRVQGIVGMLQTESEYSREEAIHVVYAFIGASAHLFAIKPTIEKSFDYDPLSSEAIERHAEIIGQFFAPRGE